MARIYGLEEQQAALREVKAALRDVTDTNMFLDASNHSKKFLISFVAEDGSKYRAFAYTENKEDLDHLVSHQKHLLANHIKRLAEKNRIVLDPEEKVAFGLELTPEEEEELTRRELAELEAAEAAYNLEEEAK